MSGKKICKEVYVPKVGNEVSPCPEGYRSADCVMIDDACYYGFEGGTLTEFLTYLHQEREQTLRTIDDLTKRVCELEWQMEAVRKDVNYLQRRM
jgi:hypothetical protein